jgi:hypothetical protein
MGRDPIRHGYRKGDNKAGGGGPSGGGGKRGRAPHGWEKGDNMRDFAEAREEVDFPRKPGSPYHERELGAPGPTQSVGETTITRWLRATNANLLTTMRKLEGTGAGDVDRRRALVELTLEQIAHKRTAEESLFPLMMDHPEVREDLLASREANTAIDQALERLVSTDPRDRGFALAVRLLHGTLEQQIEREQDTVALAEQVIPPEQATELAASLRSL